LTGEDCLPEPTSIIRNNVFFSGIRDYPTSCIQFGVQLASRPSGVTSEESNARYLRKLAGVSMQVQDADATE
tara:strand:- start:128 stop:343 length:216 start_codon:yes stop_codon:yes gene_type:complete